MIVQPITRHKSCDKFRDRMPALIEAVGTPHFAARLMNAADEAAGCEHVSVFANSESAAPQLLLAANRGSASIACAAGATFVSQFWDRDPVNSIDAAECDLDAGVAAYLPATEFAEVPYRRALYSQPDWSSSGSQIIERLSILKRHACGLLRINFYRGRQAGPFRERDIKLVTGSSDMLFALVTRHCQIAALSHKADSRADYESILRRIAPTLSKREVEVCAGITMGMTSEAIASVLGIGINTVITHRKRAYARLGISSHNELLRAVFSAAAGVVEEPVRFRKAVPAAEAPTPLPH